MSGPVTRPRQPNPGSDEAVALGCTCPIYDNNHGRRQPWPDWWITAGCPLHTEPT